MKKRMEELYNLIEKYSDEYYNNNQSSITDFEYDKLFQELIKLEEENPQFKKVNSPTIKVGGEVDNRFMKIAHQEKMLSLDNAFSIEDLIEFDESVKKVCSDYSYVAELKIDGLAMSFNYQDGKFNQAVTRGDGNVGEDVTHNVTTINGLVKEITTKSLFEVRGEVFVSKKEFERLNKIQESQNQRLFANPRNLAAGSIRQLDSKVCESRNLDAFIYSTVSRITGSHYDDLMALKEMGFNVNEHAKRLDDINDVIEFVNYWNTHRHELDYETDGIVIKVNEYINQDELGFTSRAPKWAIAYKYKAMQVETRINAITFQVGRTGKVTPVAELDSVNVSGSVVSRATLHNENYVIEKDVQIGDYVLVHKAGEIIPEVVSVVKEKRKDIEKFKMIDKCPICNSPLVKDDANHFCKNEKCEAKIIRNLIYFASISAMNIDGMGERNVEILYNEGHLKSIIDLYELKTKRELIMELEGFGERRIDLILDAIEKSKGNKLEQFVTGLGIKHVGKKISSVLVSRYKSLEGLMNATVEEMEAINEIGSAIATSAYEYFNSEEFRELYEYVSTNEFDFKVDVIQTDSEFSDKVMCVTGSFENYKRKDIEKYFTLLGAKVSSSVSKNTDYLIVGEKAGSKLEKALGFGTTIIDEEKLVLIMEDGNEKG